MRFLRPEQRTAGIAANGPKLDADTSPVAMIEPHAIIRVRFKTPSEGGRQTDVSIAGDTLYACVMMMSGEAFDCRILVRDQTLELGESYDLPVAFLAGDQVTAKLSPGVAINELARLRESGSGLARRVR